MSTPSKDIATSKSNASASSPQVATASPVRPPLIRPRILLAASGSVASIKFPMLAESLSCWADVKAVCTSSSVHFFDSTTLPPDMELVSDDKEWSSWKKLGDSVLHIELRQWADIMVIAPLSANTLAKMANGLCDNLLTCIIRAWDFSKPLLVAPAMNTFMWDSTFTSRQLATLKELGVIVVPPVSKRLACGDVGTGAMAEPASIEAAVRMALRSQGQGPGTPTPRAPPSN